MLNMLMTIQEIIDNMFTSICATGSTFMISETLLPHYAYSFCYDQNA